MGRELEMVTWNVNSVRARLPSVMRLLDERRPDLLCMQETKVEDDGFPREAFAELGYRVLASGQSRWNGVAMASRMPLQPVATGLPSGFLADQRRLLSTEVSGIAVICVYVPNGGMDERRFLEKLRYLDELGEMARETASSTPLVLLGDFNVAPGPDDVHDPEALDGTVCYHPDERSRLASMLEAGLVDAYRLFNPAGKAYSWWDYRAAAFRRDMGMRLDLVLLGGGAEEMAGSCSILREARGWERPSDHAPVALTISVPAE